MRAGRCGRRQRVGYENVMLTVLTLERSLGGRFWHHLLQEVESKNAVSQSQVMLCPNVVTPSWVLFEPQQAAAVVENALLIRGQSLGWDAVLPRAVL